MINILSAVLIVLLLIGAGSCGKGSYNEDYLASKQSKAVRGVAAIFILFHHLSFKICVEGSIFYNCYAYVGILCVAVFFFYSGYGLTISLRNKKNYMQGFIRKRFSTILVPYLMIAFIYWIWSAMNGNPYSIRYMLLSYLSGYPFVENSWYVVVILFYYLVFYILVKIDGSYNPKIILGGTILFVIIWMLLCIWRQWGSWWYVSGMALVVGVLWGMDELKICNYVKGHYVMIISGCTLIWGISWVVYIVYSSQIASIFASTFFPIALNLMLMKISFGNKIWYFFGEISYELYLVHGFFIKNLRGSDVYIQSDVGYITLIIVGSIVLAYICNWTKKPKHLFGLTKLLPAKADRNKE